MHLPLFDMRPDERFDDDPIFDTARVVERREDPLDAVLDLTPPDALPLDADGAQTSVKMGKRSSAQKMSATRYNLGSTPRSHSVGGAFGKESRDQADPVDDADTPATSAQE